MIKELIEALSLGILYGIGPCTISCAPLIVPLIMATAKDKKQGIWFSLVFGFGRIASYVALGFFAGLLGYALTGIVSKKIIGLFIIILGIALLFKINNKCIFKSKFKIKSSIMSFLAGLIYGFGPCPPLIALLTLVIAKGSAITGALMALVFGIGTILSPIIILGFFSGWFAKQKEFKETIPYVSSIFLIIIGIIYIIIK
jgi:thiol:disulfide interchange protein DsbD